MTDWARVWCLCSGGNLHTYLSLISRFKIWKCTADVDLLLLSLKQIYNTIVIKLTIVKVVKEVRSWSHVSGYFRFRSFSFPESKFSPFTCVHIEFTFPHVCDGIRIHSFMLRRHIYLLFQWKIHCRLDTILLRHWIRKYPDSTSKRYRIRCGFLFFFNSGKRIQKYTYPLLNLPDACGREVLTGETKLPIKKYTHTCGQSHDKDDTMDASK